MPSFIKTAAIAAFAGLAAAQYSNSTGPSAVSVAGWTYQGCAIATAATGSLIDSSPSMTVERCLLAASAYNYARIQGSNCYGASSVNGTTPVADNSCNTRCPGNAAEACGGSAASVKRQAAGTTVSVYARQMNIAAGVVYNTLITNIYVDYCPVCVGGTTTVGYCSMATVTACGCTSQVKPTIAMTTTVTTCSVQGTLTTLTLTVPTGVVPGTNTGTVTAPVTTTVACSTCPAASVATVGTAVVTVPAGSAVVTSTYCPGCASGSGSVVSTATAVVVTPAAATPAATSNGVVVVAASSTTKAAPSVFTGAADSVKVGSGLLAGAMAVAALL